MPRSMSENVILYLVQNTDHNWCLNRNFFSKLMKSLADKLTDISRCKI